MQINFFKREVSCKLVYYGPGMSGKTTNLQKINDKTPDRLKSKLTSIATEGERTLFFDYMPLNLGSVGGMSTKFQLYTVPGQIYYNATRKLVLQGADGLVFVADSQKEKHDENIESFQNLIDNLKEYGMTPFDIPILIQWNKRDLPTAEELSVLEKTINKYNFPSIEAVAALGNGVIETLKLIVSLVLEKLNKKKGAQAPIKTAVAQDTSAQQNTKTELIVAKINDVQLNESYLKNFFRLQTRLNSKSYKEADFNDLNAKQKEVYLDQLIDHFILVQESKKKGITSSREEVAKHMAAYVSRFGPESEYKLYLERRKLTTEDIRSEIIKKIIINKMAMAEIPDCRDRLKWTEEELNQYYQKNEGQFKGSFEEKKREVEQAISRDKKDSLIKELFDRLRGRNTIIKTNNL